MRMEKKKTRARLEKRRRKWVTKNMLSTSSWIPIMILKIFFWLVGENAVEAGAAQLVLVEDKNAAVAAPARPTSTTACVFHNVLLLSKTKMAKYYIHELSMA